MDQGDCFLLLGLAHFAERMSNGSGDPAGCHDWAWVVTGSCKQCAKYMLTLDP